MSSNRHHRDVNNHRPESIEITVRVSGCASCPYAEEFDHHYECSLTGQEYAWIEGQRIPLDCPLTNDDDDIGYDRDMLDIN